MKVISVLSGGMDSSTALAWAKSKDYEVVKAISFWYGSNLGFIVGVLWIMDLILAIVFLTGIALLPFYDRKKLFPR